MSGSCSGGIPAPVFYGLAKEPQGDGSYRIYGDQRIARVSIQVEMRTDYGPNFNIGARQHVNVDFEAPVGVVGLDEPFPGVFIRAPQIDDVGPGVEVLAAVDGRPVVVRQGSIMGATFHPELSDDPRIHQLWVTAG